MKETELHSLLRRQLKRCMPDAKDLDPRCEALLAEVNHAYRDFDLDREMLERSLELSSQELLQANSEMRALFKAIPDLLLRLNAKHEVLSSKAGTGAELLLPPNRWDGRLLSELFPKDAAQKLSNAIEQVRSDRRAASLEYEVQLNGASLVYEARLVPCPEDQVIAIIRDITDKKRTEEALDRAREKYRAFVENAIDGIFRMNGDGRITEANSAFAAILGYASPEDLITQRIDMAMQVFAEPERFAQMIRSLEEEGRVQSFEAQMKRFDGRLIWASITARRALGTDTRDCWHEGILEDITERKRLEEQFLQAQKMDAFGQLAGGVAHDFNNLLTVIVGNLGLIEDATFSSSERQLAMGEISRAAERARQLTRQLLTFSRRRHVHMKDLDLNEAVASMTRMLQRLIGEHIVLETRYAPGGAPIYADVGMIEQAIMNLVVNSRDAMPKGGFLRLHTQCIEVPPEVAVRHPGATPGPAVRLQVVDTGVGIPTDHMPHIFEPFYTTKEVGKGTGLGLATVFGIVQQHRGWIDVESVLGIGTTVTLTFPRQQHRHEEADQARDAGNRRQHIRGSERIMVVEDEAEVRALIRRILERHGYRVIEAQNGAEALNMWTRERPAVDLLITDMVMPGGVSGKELSERLRMDLPGLKAIYCSGYSNEAIGQEKWLRDGDAFLEKPLDLMPFLECVRRSLDSAPDMS